MRSAWTYKDCFVTAIAPPSDINIPAMLTTSRRSIAPSMIQVAYGAVPQLEVMISIIDFLPNEVDIGFKLNPGFVPGFFLCGTRLRDEGCRSSLPAPPGPRQ